QEMLNVLHETLRLAAVVDCDLPSPLALLQATIAAEQAVQEQGDLSPREGEDRLGDELGRRIAAHDAQVSQPLGAGIFRVTAAAPQCDTPAAVHPMASTPESSERDGSR